MSAIGIFQFLEFRFFAVFRVCKLTFTSLADCVRVLACLGRVRAAKGGVCAFDREKSLNFLIFFEMFAEIRSSEVKKSRGTGVFVGFAFLAPRGELCQETDRAPENNIDFNKSSNYFKHFVHLEMRISKPSSADVLGHFPGKFLGPDSWGVHMSCADINWGLGGPNGVLCGKRKIFDFFHIFHVWSNFRHIRVENN